MWHEFMNRPIKQQILEEAATLVAQWFQPEQHMCYSYVTTELENIAQQVMERLEVVNPQHQIFSVSREQISSWTSNNIDKDQWNNSDARQILNILSEILFEKQMFQGIKTFGNTDFLRNYLCINYVLKEKCGYIVLLAIVFQAVARRLGVCCNLLSFPVLEVSTEDYWLLQWKPKCNVTNPDDEVLYIDVLHGGIILNKNNWSRICEVAQCSISSDGYCRINSLELTAYLSYCFTATGDFVDDSICHHININWENEVCWFSELLDLLKQKGIYMPMTESIIIRNPSRCIDFARDIVTTRSRSRSYEEQFAPEPKKRTPEMRFAVGMIVKNVELDLTGVIIGWLDTKPWEMYPDSPDGCYYIVLCEDLPPEFQVSLETVDKPEPINNDEIGKYFSNFNGSFYTPNEVLAKEYAEDVVYLTTHLLRQLTLNINP
ncbi:hypothetical protein DMN91_011764 [Ooceraea biroi]|uniref:Protein SirB1 N-terminal domain-containing protein n=2 Tax=Ooceraea biroi TaxID=2015173 RepID=A0A3L8D6W6_OOCBI|nr:hypothetical protein DMN91_011764 [Ooceraea biroi]